MITVEFSAAMLHTYPSLSAKRTFEDFCHLRSTMQSYSFAPVYRIRTDQNEFGRITAKKLLSIDNDGQEHYLGEIDF